jgi:hypothetical protein
MPKVAISVTLEAQNLLWLRAQVRASARRSVSEVLDRIVTETRTSGRIEQAVIRSVVGTVRIPVDDPDLTKAGKAVRRLFSKTGAQARTRAAASSHPSQARGQRSQSRG